MCRVGGSGLGRQRGRLDVLTKVQRQLSSLAEVSNVRH